MIAYQSHPGSTTCFHFAADMFGAIAQAKHGAQIAIEIIKSTVLPVTIDKNGKIVMHTFNIKIVRANK